CSYLFSSDHSLHTETETSSHFFYWTAINSRLSLCNLLHRDEISEYWRTGRISDGILLRLCRRYLHRRSSGRSRCSSNQDSRVRGIERSQVAERTRTDQSRSRCCAVHPAGTLTCSASNLS